MKVKLFYKYSNLDKRNEFGIDCDEKIQLAWIFYYLGRFNLKRNNGFSKKRMIFYPFEAFEMKLLYTYKTNSCQRIAAFIFNKINKIINK